nr:putative ribonuclease H-like domain-containing protein [Tanacetum cinerariifolium]
MAENVIAAGFETRPPMLEKGMYDIWKTRILLYVQGKENGKMLIDSIKNEPVKLLDEITVKDAEDVNILLLGLPVDIYTLINHYQTAKEIRDCVKELVEDTQMTNQVLKNLNEARELLTKFDECIKKRTNLSPHVIGSWEKSNIKVTTLPKSKVIPKVVERNNLSKSVTSHLNTNKITEKCTKVLTLGRVSSANASGSNPKSNTENDRIPQPSSRSMTNKVKAHHRKFKSSANKNNHVSYCNVNVRNVELLKNSDTICLSYNESIMGCGDLQMGNILISCVYYVEGLGHNLFSIGKFYDSDLEVAFRKSTYFVWNLEGVDLLSGSRGSNLYTISMADMMKPMQVESINKKRYILIIVDAYSRFTWVKLLRMKDEASEIIIKILKQAQVSLNATVRYLRTDNGTEFLNQTLRYYMEDVGITHHTSTTRTPQQNSVVERRNRMLVEAVRTMLIFSKSQLSLWAEDVATTCYTQNRSVIYTRYNKTLYELLRDRKPKLKYLYVLVLYVIQRMMLRILGNFSLKQTLESLSVIHYPRRRTGSTTKGPDK